MLSIFVLFMLDLCVADQIFSCCNQTCLVKDCEDKADAPRPHLPLPSPVLAPWLLGLHQLCSGPELEHSHGNCAACGTVSPDRLAWEACPRCQEHFSQLLIPISGDGKIAQLVPCGLGALKVSAALGGRTARNVPFAIHPYRYC